MSGRELVTTEAVTKEKEFALLRPAHTPPRSGRFFQRLARQLDVPYIVDSAFKSQYVAVDFETRGNDYSREIGIVGIALAWNRGSAYIPWSELHNTELSLVTSLLQRHPGLIAHNVYFDGGVVRSTLGFHPQWDACTLALYRLLANEGWAGQQHGLKSAMVDILKWEDTNERDLDLWLVHNGYYKGARRKDESREALTRSYNEGTLSPEKGEMWRAPSYILGKYSILDAEACYLLYTEHLLPHLNRFPELEKFFREEFMTHILIHIDQKIRGILVDVPALHARRDVLIQEIGELRTQFLTHPTTTNHIARMEEAMLDKLRVTEPERYKKLKPMPQEPPKYTKSGALSKNWEKWVDNQYKYTVPVQSKNWENWQERLRLAEEGKDSSYKFNMNSGDQMRELLYERMGYQIREITETGLPAVGADAYKHMGEIGQLLIAHIERVKELGFIEKYIELTQDRDTIHPSFNLPGTSTGRLSSKEPNLQQLPKTKRMMDLFLARPGYVWVDLDFRALENVVAAELSEDPNLYNLYGDDVPENDSHLFLASHIPAWKESIAATGYQPYNPPPGSVARAKKEAKSQRNKAKTVVYACQYGGGVDKIYQTLTNDGVDISYEEVQELHQTYWRLFDRLKKYSYELQDQWRENGYWVMNGLGRPMCLTPDYRKDCLSRVLQSTGHDILIKYIVRCLVPMLDDRQIEWYPLIIDLHDAVTVEVREDQAEEVVEIFNQSMVELNRLVGGRIKLGGTPTVGRSMTEIKEPEE